MMRMINELQNLPVQWPTAIYNELQARVLFYIGQRILPFHPFHCCSFPSCPSASSAASLPARKGTNRMITNKPKKPKERPTPVLAFFQSHGLECGDVVSVEFNRRQTELALVRELHLLPDCARIPGLWLVVTWSGGYHWVPAGQIRRHSPACERCGGTRWWWLEQGDHTAI
jgi:hypothetical protein